MLRTEPNVSLMESYSGTIAKTPFAIRSVCIQNNKILQVLYSHQQVALAESLERKYRPRPTERSHPLRGWVGFNGYSYGFGFQIKNFTRWPLGDLSQACWLQVNGYPDAVNAYLELRGERWGGVDELIDIAIRTAKGGLI